MVHLTHLHKSRSENDGALVWEDDLTLKCMFSVIRNFKSLTDFPQDYPDVIETHVVRSCMTRHCLHFGDKERLRQQLLDVESAMIFPQKFQGCNCICNCVWYCAIHRAIAFMTCLIR